MRRIPTDSLEQQPSHAEVTPALVVFALAVVLAAQIIAFHATRTDDAFITYRYGQNLAEGNGLTFNPGERLLGSTSAAHMLLSGLVYALVGPEATPSVMAALGCLGWSAQAVAVYFLLLGALGRSRALLLALAFEFGAALSYRFVALETNLLAALALWAFVSARHARLLWTAALCAAAVLTRPDAWLLALLLGAGCAWQARKRLFFPALFFTALVTPWFLFACWYYGSPLPRSALEKVQRTDFSLYLEHTLLAPVRALLPLAPDWLALGLGWPLILFGAVWLVRRERGFWMLAAYPLIHAAAYLVLRPFTEHRWHLYPLDFCGVLFAFTGLLAFVSHRTVAVRRGAQALLGALLVAFLWRMGDSALQLRESFWGGARDDVYRRIAYYLKQNAREGESFASVEVGTIAYYSRLQAFDMGGLVTDVENAAPERSVRFIVLDQHYLYMAPPFDPDFGWRSGDFSAFVFRIPEGKHMLFKPLRTR